MEEERGEKQSQGRVPWMGDRTGREWSDAEPWRLQWLTVTFYTTHTHALSSSTTTHDPVNLNFKCFYFVASKTVVNDWTQLLEAGGEHGCVCVRVHTNTVWLQPHANSCPAGRVNISIGFGEFSTISRYQYKKISTLGKTKCHQQVFQMYQYRGILQKCLGNNFCIHTQLDVVMQPVHFMWK